MKNGYRISSLLGIDGDVILPALKRNLSDWIHFWAVVKPKQLYTKWIELVSNMDIDKLNMKKVCSLHSTEPSVLKIGVISY